MTTLVFRLIPFLLILCVGCRTTSKTQERLAIVADNKDVVVLSYLIRDYLRKTNNRRFTLSDIENYDTSRRVTRNFSRLEIGNWSDIWNGGYAVYFKFSDERKQDSIKLMPHERIPWRVKTKKKIGKNSILPDTEYDGEILLYYPERFYHVVSITMKESSK